MNSEKHMSNLRDELSNTIALKDKHNYGQTLSMITYAHHLSEKIVFSIKIINSKWRIYNICIKSWESLIIDNNDKL